MQDQSQTSMCIPPTVESDDLEQLRGIAEADGLVIETDKVDN